MWDNENIISQHCIGLNSISSFRGELLVLLRTQDICFINLLLRDKDFIFKI